MFVRFNKLSSIYKNKPLNKLFKLKDSNYGYLDCIIYKYYWCDNCDRMFNNMRAITKWSKLPHYAKKCSCGNKKPSYMYMPYTCRYTNGNCKINSWGCSIHYKETKHSFTCTCDQCY